MTKLPGAEFDIGLTLDHGRAVLLTITSIEGDRYFVPIEPDVAEELGRQLLAGALALNGRLVIEAGAHD